MDGLAAFSVKVLIYLLLTARIGWCRALVLCVTRRGSLPDEVPERGLYIGRLVFISPPLSSAPQLTQVGVLLP